MSVIRSSLKTLVEVGAVVSGAEAIARRIRTRRVSILAYHNVVPDADTGFGETSLHLRYTSFCRQIDRLQRTHDIVDLDSALEPALSGRPRAVLTFDDAYFGAVSFALPELIRRGLPATMFVAPGILGEAGMWWDELAHSGLLDNTARDFALNDRRGRNRDVREWAYGASTRPVLPRSYGIATESELIAACGEGISLGAHGWSHSCLPTLDAKEIDAELDRCRQWFDACSIRTVRWLALPYGEGSATVLARALDHGFHGVLEIRGGRWNGDASWTLPRINVPAGISDRGLALRTSGLLR